MRIVVALFLVVLAAPAMALDGAIKSPDALPKSVINDLVGCIAATRCDAGPPVWVSCWFSCWELRHWRQDDQGRFKRRND